MGKINYYELLKLRLISENKEYKASIYNEKTFNFIFRFTSFNDNSGLNIQNYYNELLKNKNEIDVKLELKKVKMIEIYNTNIDPLCIDILSSIFSNLSVLEIRNSNIKKIVVYQNLM